MIINGIDINKLIPTSMKAAMAKDLKAEPMSEIKYSLMKTIVTAHDALGSLGYKFEDDNGDVSLYALKILVELLDEGFSKEKPIA